MKHSKNLIRKTQHMWAQFHLQSSEEHPKSCHPKNTTQEPEPGHRGCCGNGDKAPEQDGPRGESAGNSRARAAAQVSAAGPAGFLQARLSPGPQSHRARDLWQLLLPWCSLGMGAAWELIDGTP